MKEQKIAKFSFLIGAPFFLIAAFDGYFGIFDYSFSMDAPPALNWAVRIAFGIGFICLFVNLFLMWRKMFLNRQWGWLLSSIPLVFISTLLYYKIHYEKHSSKGI